MYDGSSRGSGAGAAGFAVDSSAAWANGIGRVSALAMSTARNGRRRWLIMACTPTGRRDRGAHDATAAGARPARAESALLEDAGAEDTGAAQRLAFFLVIAQHAHLLRG